MEEKHKLAEEISLAQSLQMLAMAYEEISVMKMRVVRDKVLHTRDFLDSLSDVFVNVKTSYHHKLQESAQNNEGQKILHFSTHQTNGKEIFVLLSAKNKLYGDIAIKTFLLFQERLQNTDADIAIVGNIGKDLFETYKLSKPYTYFDLPDFIKSVEELKPLITHILQYEKVTMFYGRFTNIVSQEAVASSITGDAPLQQKNNDQRQEYGFLFEPSVESVLEFFESQIFTSLLKQTIVESELALLASRIKTMEQAIVFANMKIDALSTAQKRAKQQIENKKQLERVAGMKLWGRRR